MEAVLLEEEELTIRSQFAEVVSKLKNFCLKVAVDSGVTGEQVRLLVMALDKSVLAYIMIFQTWFKIHAVAIAKRDMDYFQKLLPVAYHSYIISDENRAKGVQFLEAIEELLKDYNRE
jgi:hypothetical protein